MHRRNLVGLSVLLAALVTARASTIEVRTALAVSIGGVQVPIQAQPRVVVEQERGASDQARIRVAGTLGVSYAHTIAPGDPIDIVATAPDGSSTTVFHGEVTFLEPGFDTEPVVVIHGLGTLGGGEPSDNGVTIAHGLVADARLVDFAARLSARSSIQGVLVTGILEPTGEPIAGRALAPAIALGDEPTEWSGAIVTVETELRFTSQDEADELARVTLAERLANRVSAEVLTDGIAALKVNEGVEIKGLGTSFDGAYYVTGVKHQFGGDSYGGYSTSLRLRRADLGMFHHPEIDDEVLVAFEAGDALRPYVVGSLWDCEGGREERSDDRRCRLLRWPW